MGYGPGLNQGCNFRILINRSRRSLVSLAAYKRCFKARSLRCLRCFLWRSRSFCVFGIRSNSLRCNRLLSTYRFKYGASRLILRFTPRLVTSCIRSICRRARFDFRRRKCDCCPLVRMIFPLPVTRKRFAVALCVLSLYFFDLPFPILFPPTTLPLFPVSHPHPKEPISRNPLFPGLFLATFLQAPLSTMRPARFLLES